MGAAATTASRRRKRTRKAMHRAIATADIHVPPTSRRQRPGANEGERYARRCGGNALAITQRDAGGRLARLLCADGAQRANIGRRAHIFASQRVRAAASARAAVRECRNAKEHRARSRAARQPARHEDRSRGDEAPRRQRQRPAPSQRRAAKAPLRRCAVQSPSERRDASHKRRRPRSRAAFDIAQRTRRLTPTRSSPAACR